MSGSSFYVQRWMGDTGHDFNVDNLIPTQKIACEYCGAANLPVFLECHQCGAPLLSGRFSDETIREIMHSMAIAGANWSGIDATRR